MPFEAESEAVGGRTSASGRHLQKIVGKALYLYLYCLHNCTDCIQMAENSTVRCEVRRLSHTLT